jgi:hypothetical protein
VFAQAISSSNPTAPDIIKSDGLTVLATLSWSGTKPDGRSRSPDAFGNSARKALQSAATSADASSGDTPCRNRPATA